MAVFYFVKVSLDGATMSAYPLESVRVEKPWGRHNLWPGFADPAPDAPPVGEIIFGDDDSGALLVKYLFTSERLSIQVHPDDDEARASGFPRGKDEVWVILDAEPDATIALGLVNAVSKEALRVAALDGTIETLVEWKPVKAGDVIYSPAGTVHAIGAGITLVEIQQNVDLTYRLYDYGRPRELHLDAGMAVSRPEPFVIARQDRVLESGRIILAEGRKFVLEQWDWSGERTLAFADPVPGWLIPLAGAGSVDGMAWATGECWMIEGGATVSAEPGAKCLFAYPLATPPTDLFG
jgi:mannose-6-phosphate isomerase